MNYLISIIATVMLLIAIPSGLPYAYYILLRWVICGAAIYISILSSDQEKQYLVWIFGTIALLFNPIFPFYLGKGIWVIIDAIAALLFFISLFIVKPYKY